MTIGTGEKGQGQGKGKGKGQGQAKGKEEGKLRLEKPLIIIDLQNVAMRHGNKTFSCKGIEIVVQYWMSKGHKVVGFMPEYALDEDRVGETIRLQKINPSLCKPSQIPDNVPLLNAMQKKVAPTLIIHLGLDRRHPRPRL